MLMEDHLINFSFNLKQLVFKQHVSLVFYSVMSHFVSILFSLDDIGLVLCAEGRLRPVQREPYDEIKIFVNEKYNPMKVIVPDVQQEKAFPEPMENDEQF